MKLRLTDAVAAEASLNEGQVDCIIWDQDLTGFGLRLRPGSKSWIVAYRPVGRGRSANMKRLKLASPSVMPAVEARKLARSTLGKIAAGGDPLVERRELRRQAKARVSELLDRYEDDLERRRYVNRKMAMATLRRGLGQFRSQDIKSVSGADLVAVIEAYDRSGRPGAAADFRSRCSAFLSWCVAKARAIDSNPLSGYRRTRTTRADRIARTEHGRALSDEDLALVWAAAKDEETFGRLVRFLILTGCRRHEAGGLCRSMIDRPNRVIRFPAAFVKQGRDHIIPYPEAVEQILRLCPIDSRSDLVFPSPRTGRTINGWSKMVPKFRNACGVHFQLHDLRRTCRTGLSRLGVDAGVAELALGHARHDLEATYNRDDSIARLRAAFEGWAGHIERLAGSRYEFGLFR